MSPKKGTEMSIVFYLDTHLMLDPGFPDIDNLVCARRVNGGFNTVFYATKKHKAGSLSEKNIICWTEKYGIGAMSSDAVAKQKVCPRRFSRLSCDIAPFR
jgi:hypothetical protein